MQNHSKSKRCLPTTQRLLLVSFARNLFALPVNALLHRTAKSSLLAAPDLPPIFAGFMRDPAAERLVPVVQPRSLFQLPVITPPTTKDQALLVSVPMPKALDKTMALLVDELLGQFEQDVSAFLPAYGGHYLLTCVSHTVEIAGEFHPLISPEALLAEIEEHCQGFLAGARQQQGSRQRAPKPRRL